MRRIAGRLAALESFVGGCPGCRDSQAAVVIEWVGPDGTSSIAPTGVPDRRSCPDCDTVRRTLRIRIACDPNPVDKQKQP